MSKPKILIQLDSDPHPSVFDAVTAVDSGIDHLFQYGDVTPERVRDLIHGAMFTRGPQDLKSTAVFLGGSNVATGESLLKKATECFFGPMRVSVMLDANGANTTAAAAVLAATKHGDWNGATATVLGGTGPVGQRAARLLARLGARVRVASRSMERSTAACEAIRSVVPQAELEAVQTTNAAELASSLTGSQVIIAAGAAGVELIGDEAWQACGDAKVMIDLNAVPPVGIAGIASHDKGVEHRGVVCYGALGVGGMKMKIHKAAIASLFESNSLVLDAEEIFEIGRKMS